MSLFSSLKQMFVKSGEADHQHGADCDHGSVSAETKECSDECCKDGAVCSTEGCDCKHA